jgi:hypothetical protein
MSVARNVGWQRREELIVDISTRLRRVCRDMADDQFSALVRNIARVTQKYEGAVTPAGLGAAVERHPERDSEAP